MTLPPHRPLLAACTLPFLALLAGCSSYSAPALTVTDATIAPGTRGEAGTVVNIHIEAENNNEVALPLSTVRYSVFMGNELVFSGVRSAEATLRRFGTQHITLPIVLKGPRTATGPFRIEGELTYQTPGSIAKILYDADFERPTVAFSGKGVINN